MTDRQPHRCLTCDSCGHAEKTNSKTYPFKCLVSKPIPMMVHEYCIGWFGYVGCASHTSPPAPAQPIESTKGMEHRKSRLDPDGSTGAPEREESRHTCTNLNEHDAQVAKAEREQVQPFIDFTKAASLKHNEMVDLMRRNKLKIDDLKDPMQKLAFTFFTEIGEMSHKADVVLEEYTESLRGAQEEQQAGEHR